MCQPATQIENLSKTYRVPERESGMKAALGSLVHRRQRKVKGASA